MSLRDPANFAELGRVQRELGLLLCVPNAEDRPLTADEDRRWRALHRRRLAALEISVMPEGPGAHAGGPGTRAAGRLGAAERAAILGEPRPAPVATAAPAVTLADHKRAVEANLAFARAVATEEAGHMVVGCAEGLPAESAGITYARNILTGALEIAGGYARFAGAPTIPAATAIAGLEALRMWGLESALTRDAHARDEQLERAAIGYDWTARKQATRYARAILTSHTAVVSAIADRIVATGHVEGAELERLLAPVRQRAA